MTLFQKTLVTTCLGLLCLLPNANAQNEYSVKEYRSEKTKLRGHHIIGVFQKNDGSFWSVSRQKQRYTFSSYDAKFNLLDQRSTYMEFKHKYLQLDTVCFFQGRYVCFLSFENRKKKKRYLFYSFFDPVNLEIQKDLVKIGEVKTEKRDHHKPYFKIRTKPNSNFILVLGMRSSARDNKDPWWKFWVAKDWKYKEPWVDPKISFWLLDSDLQIVNYEKGHRVRAEKCSDDFELRNATWDESGTVYFIGENLDSEEETAEKVALDTSKLSKLNYPGYVLQKIDSSGNTITMQPGGEGLYRDANVYIDDNGIIHLVAVRGSVRFDPEWGDYGIGSQGVEYLRLDPKNLDTLFSSFYPFSEAVLDELNPLRLKQQASKGKRGRRFTYDKDSRMDAIMEESKNLVWGPQKVVDLVIDPSGNVFTVLEEQEHVVVITTNEDNTNPRRTEYNYYRNLVLILMLMNEQDEDALQATFTKSFRSVNHKYPYPTVGLHSDGLFGVIAQAWLLSFNPDNETIEKHVLKGSKTKNTRKLSMRSRFNYRKVMSDNLIILANARGPRVQWITLQPLHE